MRFEQQNGALSMAKDPSPIARLVREICCIHRYLPTRDLSEVAFLWMWIYVTQGQGVGMGSHAHGASH